MVDVLLGFFIASPPFHSLAQFPGARRDNMPVLFSAFRRNQQPNNRPK
jgi:hypothetical protein